MTFDPRKALPGLLCAFALPVFSGTAVAQNFATPATATLPEAPSALQEAGAGREATGLATLSGVVSDIRGGLVPNAEIKLQDKARNTLRETTSNSAGTFVFANLAAGTYTVLISAKGLETFLSEPVTLKANGRFELPEIALRIAPANTSVDVASNSATVADQELQVETSQRVLGILPNYYTSFVFNAAPLNTKQKFRLSLRATLDPVAFVIPAIVAEVEQANDTYPGWSTDTAGYFKRYWADFGDAFVGRNLGSGLFPTVFHQDPRYFYMGPTHPTGKRLWHAISAGIIARGDNGHLQPNYSHIVGNASAGALSSVYHPASNSAQSLAFQDALFGIGGTAVQSLLREFVLPYITTHVPAYARGKSAPEPAAVPAAAPVPAPAPGAIPAPTPVPAPAEAYPAATPVKPPQPVNPS